MANAEKVQLWIQALNSFENGQVQDAISEFQRFPSNSKNNFNIGCCYLHIKDFDRAREVCVPTKRFHLLYNTLFISELTGWLEFLGRLINGSLMMEGWIQNLHTC